MKPAIIGLDGVALTSDERALLREHVPLGVIMFARNVADPGQLASLVASLRDCLPEHAVLMVDQEGGRVARLRPPAWRAHPPARALRTPRAAWLTGALIGLDCAEAGFTLVAAPVLDVGDPNGHDVIGDRAFAGDPATVASMGEATEKLHQLRPVSFHLKSDPDGALQYGLIAEEVDKIYPELVIRDAAGAIQGVRYDELAPLLLKEAQTQNAQIAEMRKQLSVMQAAILQSRANDERLAMQ